MSQENVEIVRSIYEAWERGDFRSAEWADPEIEYLAADGPITATAKGLDQLAEAHREFLRTWDEWRVEAEGYRDVGDERVLVLFHFSGRGKASGLEIGSVWTKGASLFHLRDGKVTRLVQYFDRERALEAAGLSE